MMVMVVVVIRENLRDMSISNATKTGRIVVSIRIMVIMVMGDINTVE
jgi:hypothetical protein